MIVLERTVLRAGPYTLVCFATLIAAVQGLPSHGYPLETLFTQTRAATCCPLFSSDKIPCELRGLRDTVRGFAESIAARLCSLLGGPCQAGSEAHRDLGLVSMLTQSLRTSTLCRGGCALRPHHFRSFIQQRFCNSKAGRRQKSQCVRARFEPSEASESIGRLDALFTRVSACNIEQDKPRVFTLLIDCAESSKEQEALVVPQIETEADRSALQSFLYPDASELSNSEMPIWDHLDELRERILIAALAAGGAILTCFCFSKDLVVFLEAPVAEQGVRFLQLSPGEFFFTTFKVCAEALLTCSL